MNHKIKNYHQYLFFQKINKIALKEDHNHQFSYLIFLLNIFYILINQLKF